jgi:hypothetical protein
MAIFNVPIAKGGPSAFVEIDSDALDAEDYKLVVAEGLKALCNARMSKVGAVTKLEGADLANAQAHALRIAEENKTMLLAGKLRSKAAGRKAKSDISREVQIEARRIGREMVKNLIRANGGQPSKYKASEITAAADNLIASDATILDKARENLANRASIAMPGADILAGLAPDPKLVAAAEAKKAAAKANKPLSAKQAGMAKAHVPPRTRPAADAHHVH